MADVPTKEPEIVRAGDTIKWEKDLSDYSAADSWVLKYALRGNSEAIDITAAASGSKHLVTITAAISAGYNKGIYDCLGYVEKGSERYSVFIGKIKVEQDLEAAGSSHDPRSHVKKVLDSIESVLENRATKEVLESTIEGVAIKRITHEELILMRQKYLAFYEQELAADKIKRGLGTSRTILTRFK